jgi:predicted ATPase
MRPLTESPNRSLLDVITEALHSRYALLILDNCEHVLSGCAALVRTLLTHCPEDESSSRAWSRHHPLRVASRQPAGDSLPPPRRPNRP